jgi:hypothetical protein
VAAKATCWLTAEGFGVDVKLVEVVAWFTVKFATLVGELFELLLKFGLVLVNVAVIVCAAGGPGNAKVQAGTVPPDVKVVVHKFPLTLSVKATVPWGTVGPLFGLMAAVNVTGWLTTEVVADDVKTTDVFAAVTVAVTCGLTGLIS